MSGLFSTHSVASITAEAMIPEQLVHYVTSVSGLEASLCGSHVLYTSGDAAVFVVFDPAWFQGEALCTYDFSTEKWHVDDRVVTDMRDALAKLPSSPWKTLTVLSPLQADQYPSEYKNVQNNPSNVHTDSHWFLPLPVTLESLPAKVRNMIRHGEQACTIQQEPWSAEHTRLVAQILPTKNLAIGTQHIYKQLAKYAEASTQGARLALISARSPKDKILQGFVIGDLTALTTAFYMFAFRSPTAPAGTADALLFALVKEAMAAGHTRLSLGLGIHGGVAHFKKKWNAVPYMPHTETVLTASVLRKTSLWARLFIEKENAR